jgi:hypothetical protein
MVCRKLSLNVSQLSTIGRTPSKYMQIVLFYSSPEIPLGSSAVLPRPVLTIPKALGKAKPA